MKVNGKSVVLTSSLILVLLIIILVEISLFISGPSRKYDAKIEQQKEIIQEKYRQIKDLDRHVFHYIVYIGEDNKNIVWFNENGDAIVSKSKDTLRYDEALQQAKKLFGFQTGDVLLGYGYDNPVYVIQSGEETALLDYDTLKKVYYMDKGVAK